MRQIQSVPVQIRYLVVGIWNTIVGYSLYTFLIFLLTQSQYLLALVLSTIFAGTHSYYTQRKFVWKSQSEIKGEISKFFIVFTTQFALNLILLYALVEYQGFSPIISQYVLGVAIVVSTYFVNKKWTFSS